MQGHFLSSRRKRPRPACSFMRRFTALNENGKRYRDILILVASITFVICVILLVFFRTGIIVKAVSVLAAILMPFIFGFVFAYLLRPVALTFEKWIGLLFDRMKIKHRGSIRMISILLTMVLLLLMLGLLVMAIVPGVVSSVTTLVQSLNTYVRQFEAWLESINAGSENEAGTEMVGLIEQAVQTVTNRLNEWLSKDLLPTLTSQMNKVTASFSSILSIIKNFGLGLIISVYLLSGWEKYMAQAKLIAYSVLPGKAADWLGKEVRFVDRSFSGFISGKIIDSAIIGLICFAFSMIAGLPYGILVSVIVGITNIIPFFGPYLGAIPSALLILTESPWKCLVFVVFIIILQQVDGNVIGPMILGDKVGLSSFWILFAILFFGALWGLVGMIVGVPIFAVAYDLAARSVGYGLKKKNRTDLLDAYHSAFPDEEKEKPEKK